VHITFGIRIAFGDTNIPLTSGDQIQQRLEEFNLKNDEFKLIDHTYTKLKYFKCRKCEVNVLGSEHQTTLRYRNCEGSRVG